MTDTPATIPSPEDTEAARYTTREELNALGRFARQARRLSPAGRAWLAAYVTSLDTGP